MYIVVYNNCCELQLVLFKKITNYLYSTEAMMYAYDCILQVISKIG